MDAHRRRHAATERRRTGRFTVRQGRAVLWYPERKFFLLGRVIGPEWFER